MRYLPVIFKLVYYKKEYCIFLPLYFTRESEDECVTKIRKLFRSWFVQPRSHFWRYLYRFDDSFIAFTQMVKLDFIILSTSWNFRGNFRSQRDPSWNKRKASSELDFSLTSCLISENHCLSGCNNWTSVYSCYHARISECSQDFISYISIRFTGLWMCIFSKPYHILNLMFQNALRWHTGKIKE